MKHFIQKAIETCMAHYAVMDETITDYNRIIEQTLKSPHLTPEYKRSHIREIKVKHRAFCDAKAPELKRKLSAIFDEERKRVTEGVSGRLPTVEQLTTLEALRSRKELSQIEFDAYGQKMAGVYLAEKALAEIAKDRGLTPPAFVTLDRQLDRVEKVEKLFIPETLSYTGSPSAREYFWAGSTVTALGTGIPSNARYIEKHLNEIIRDYESQRFTEAPPEKSAYQMLQEMIAEFPENERDIKEFIAKHKDKFEDEIFRDEFAKMTMGLAGNPDYTSKTADDLTKLFGNKTVSDYIRKLKAEDHPAPIPEVI